MIHPNVSLRFIDDVVGFGVFADRPLPAGTITWCLDPLDFKLAPSDVRALGPLFADTLDKYAWTDRDGDQILCWDLGRYMNHSCAANSMSPGFSFEVAVRDIAAGDEIVCDYGMLNLDTSFECACGAPTCRGTIHPTDFDRLASAWDGALAAVVPQVLDVPQALLSLVPAVERAQLDSIAAGTRPVPTVLTHRSPNPPSLAGPANGARALPEGSRPTPR